MATLAAEGKAGCFGAGTEASVRVEGDVLFLDLVGGAEGLSQDIGTSLICYGGSGVDPIASAGATFTPPAAGSATNQGRAVDACSACDSSEFCLAYVFQGDACLKGSGGGASPSTCPAGTTFDQGSGCCLGDSDDDEHVLAEAARMRRVAHVRVRRGGRGHRVHRGDQLLWPRECGDLRAGVNRGAGSKSNVSRNVSRPRWTACRERPPAPPISFVVFPAHRAVSPGAMSERECIRST